MSEPLSPAVSVAWISRGRLFVQAPGKPLREIESDFAKQSLEREFREVETNAWKGRSGVWGNLGMQPPGMAPWESQEPRRQIRFATIARGKSASEIFYVLDMGAVGGLFSYDLEKDIERRLVHRQGFVLTDVVRHSGDGELAMSVPRGDGTVGLKVTRPDGLFGRDLGLSDSADEAPYWHADGSKRLVFHSSAFLRNERGLAVGKSACRIELLDLESEQLSTLVEDEAHDLLQPRSLPDGSLVYIRRPYKPVQQFQQASLLDVAKDIVLFPYRLLRTFVYFFNFMSMMFSGKPLISAGGPNTPAGKINPYLMLWGQAVDTQRILNQDRPGRARAALVPNDWQLIRRATDGTESKLANNVLAWDISSSGEIIYTDGRSVYRLNSSGEYSRVADADLIERLAVLS